MKKYFILLAMAIYLMACDNERQNHQEPQEEQTTHDEEHHHHESESIVLDNGKKWKVAEGMVVYIRNMEKAINDFETLENKDYTALAKTIDTNIRELTSNCTMKGQAHDELHKWLVPFIELSEEFDVATDPKEQEKIYQAFKNSFIEFNTYFE
ncbi:MAG: hypothetical protein ACLGGV_03665 [Bacteroidia bacterium]